MVKIEVSTCSRDLQRVAAVDEQHRPLHQHDGGAGGAGKAGEPGEPLLARRHIFVLVAVGARNDQAGQAAPRQFGAQRGNARPARRALACDRRTIWKRASNMAAIY